MEKKKRANRRRKSLVSVSFAVLIISSAASIGVSTYAYAASSSLLTFSNIGVQTIVPASINIGLKNQETGDISYYDQLTNDSFTDNGLAEPNFVGLYPVSSTYKENWLIKDEDDTYNSVTPKFVREYVSGQDSQNPGYALASRYYQVDMYFQEEDTQSLGTNFYLSNLTKMVADTDKNKVAAAKDATLDADDLDKIIDSLRVSILTPNDYFIIDFNKKDDVIQAGPLNLSDSDEYYDYTFGTLNEEDGEANKELLYGEYTNSENVVWDDPLESDSGLSDPNSSSSAFNAKEKAGVRPVNIEESIENGVELKVEDSIALEDIVFDDNKSDEENIKLFSLDPGESKRIVITYYIEGWDLDNINDVQYASFLSNLAFTGEYDYSYRDIG